MASSILGRKVLPAATAALTANLTCTILDEKLDGSWAKFSSASRTLCEAMNTEKAEGGAGKSILKASDNMFLFRESGVRETVLRRRVSASVHK